MIGLELALRCLKRTCNECPDKEFCEQFIGNYGFSPDKLIRAASWCPDSFKDTYFDLALMCLTINSCKECRFYTGQMCGKGMDGEYDPGDFLLELCREVDE